MSDRAAYRVYACVSWALALGCMLMIFWFSAQSGDQSSRLSLEVTDVVLTLLRPDVPLNRGSVAFARAHHLVRKAGHATEYALMAALLMAALAPFRMKTGRKLLLTLLVCVVYAMLDEFHQGFSFGRTPAIKDVLIDTGGAFLGCLASLIFRWIVMMAARTGPFWRRR